MFLSWEFLESLKCQTRRKDYLKYCIVIMNVIRNHLLLLASPNNCSHMMNWLFSKFPFIFWGEGFFLFSGHIHIILLYIIVGIWVFPYFTCPLFWGSGYLPQAQASWHFTSTPDGATAATTDILKTKSGTTVKSWDEVKKKKLLTIHHDMNMPKVPAEHRNDFNLMAVSCSATISWQEWN